MCWSMRVLPRESGGYPEGYRKVALGAGMTRGTRPEIPLARRDVLGMIYNCLDVYLGGPSYNRVGDWTLSGRNPPGPASERECQDPAL